jgi:hypothetical protein
VVYLRRLALLGLVLLAAGSAAVADDVVHFANGTFMKVQSYVVDGDMIKVTLGPGATMSFPTTLVESIERSGRTVYPQTPAGPSNVVVSGGAGGQVSGGGQYVQSGEHQVPARHRPGALSGENTIEDKEAVARRDQSQFQMSGGRTPLRALGRRSVPVGEALVDKDPTAPPPGVLRPRGFTSLAPRGASPTIPSESIPEPAPPEPPPAETEPVDDPPAGDED